MPQPIQDAGLSDRLRRFFKLRGRTSFQLDETVVPVVVLETLSGPYYPIKNIFARGRSPAKGSAVANTTFQSQAAIYFGPFVDPQVASPLPGVFTIDSISVSLDELQGTLMTPTVSEPIQFQVLLAAKKEVLLGAGIGPPDFEAGLAYVSDWPTGNTRKRVPVVSAAWNERFSGTAAGTTIAEFILGVPGPSTQLVGGLSTGLGLAFDGVGAVIVSPVKASPLAGSEGVGFIVNWAGHYDSEAAFE